MVNIFSPIVSLFSAIFRLIGRVYMFLLNGNGTAINSADAGNKVNEALDDSKDTQHLSPKHSTKQDTERGNKDVHSVLIHKLTPGNIESSQSSVTEKPEVADGISQNKIPKLEESSEETSFSTEQSRSIEESRSTEESPATQQPLRDTSADAMGSVSSISDTAADAMGSVSCCRKVATHVDLPCNHLESWNVIKGVLERMCSISKPQDDIDGQINDLATNLTSLTACKYNIPSCELEDTPFEKLITFLQNCAYDNDEEVSDYLIVVFPTIARLALKLEDLSPNGGVPYLIHQEPGIQVFSKEQAASFLACAFLCLFPDAQEPSLCMPHVNFTSFFPALGRRLETQAGKLRMFLNYFRRLGDPPLVAAQTPNDATLTQTTSTSSMQSASLLGNILFERVVIAKRSLTMKELCKTTKPLCPLVVSQTGLIEDSDPAEYIHADFANAYIGGGVLGAGRVQEEIRFSVSPELCVACMFMERMEDNEAIIIKGFETFSRYTGYGNTLGYGGDYEDQCPRDGHGDLMNTLTAIDATPYSYKYPGPVKQYQISEVNRELLKAYAGFAQSNWQLEKDNTSTSENDEAARDSGSEFDRESAFATSPLMNDTNTSNSGSEVSTTTPASRESEKPKVDNSEAAPRARKIATGNWGCGAFGGDPQLKLLIQWLAASYADCPELMFYTFGHPEMDELETLISIVCAKKVSLPVLASVLGEYLNQVTSNEISPNETRPFQFVMQNLTA